MVVVASAKSRRARKSNFVAARKKKTGAIRLNLTNILLIIIIVVLVAYIVYPNVVGLGRQEPFGNRTTGIDTKLSAPELGAINNAPNGYFEQAGENLLNISIPGEQISNGTYYSSASDFEIGFGRPQQYNTLDYNGKPSVIYIGAISCVWCGENRWAMALALSRFGSFGSLYNGYSAVQDGDVPTLYWKYQNITSSGTADFGNSYTSNYINFFSAEYDSNIKGGFEFPSSKYPISFFVSSAPNQSYYNAMAFMNNTDKFEGTPFTFWGTSLDMGAVGVVLGTPQNGTQTSSNPPLTYMTQGEILGQLGSFNSTFAQEEYATADMYVAQMCHGLNNTAPVCALPAIGKYESKMGLQ